MTFLILVAICTWSFGSPLPNPITMFPASIEQASIMVYQHNKNTRVGVEPNRYEYKLYKINLDNKTIKEIEIPVLKFESEGE